MAGLGELKKTDLFASRVRWTRVTSCPSCLRFANSTAVIAPVCGFSSSGFSLPLSRTQVLMLSSLELAKELFELAAGHFLDRVLTLFAADHQALADMVKRQPVMRALNLGR